MNKVIYKSTYYGKTFTFTDIDILNSTMTDTLNNALVSETVSIDTASFTIIGRERGGTEPLYDEDGEQIYDEDNEPIYVNVLNYAAYDFSKFVYGDEIDYYIDNTLYGKYYLVDVSVAGDGSGEITFRMESVMGLLNDISHPGGIYVGATAGSIIASIMGSYSYTIDGTLSATTLNGWLPYDSCLANLTQVLFACGASVMKDANGDLDFTYNLPQTASVYDERYLGGYVVDITPATIVKVTEHSFFASSGDAETLFDNSNDTPVTNYEIRFDQPYHTLTATGLTINSSGANWAIVSGLGTLEGTPYLHVKRIRNKSTGVTGKTVEKSAENCTLISSLNSEQTLDRLASYYAQVQEVQVALNTDTERPGALLQIPNPKDNDSTILGYIKGMKRTFSGILKSEITLTSGWFPSHIGNSYDSFAIFRQSDIVNGVWPVPPALQNKRSLIVLFGGAQGGQGGWYGHTADRIHGLQTFASYIMDKQNIRYSVGNAGSVGTGADGGNGGKGGYPGKLIMFNLASLDASYAASLGTGGTGGSGGTVVRDTRGWMNVTETDPTDGAYGTHSTLAGYDTDNGYYIEADFVNLITGQVIAPKNGETGIAGAKGGNGGASKTYVKNSTSQTYDYSSAGKGKNGSNVGANTGGTGADGAVGYTREAYSSTTQNKRYHHIMLAGGGGGGGAAAGANGNNGTVQSYFARVPDENSDYDCYTGKLYVASSSNPSDTSELISSNGGDGANAVTLPAQSDLCGGTGGNGGGGGGGAGSQLGYDGAVYLDGALSRGWGMGGKGGNGAQGGQGSDGWFVAYFKEDILPDGYKRLDYIRSAGDAYIVTDITASGDVTISIEAEGEPTSSNQVWVSRSNNGLNWFGLLSGGNWSGGSGLVGTTKINAVLSLTDSGFTGYANNTEVSSTQAPTNKTKVAFMANNAGSYKATGKLYRANVYMNGAYVFMGIPALNSSNVAGLYDMVSGNFYTSKTATPFEAGNVI